MKIMSVKEFVVILGLSVVVWYGSRYVKALFDVFIISDFNIDIYGSSCLPTGYPLFYCADNSLSLMLLGGINVAVWFVTLLLIWKLFLHFKKSLKK
jgi:hypothetical protein